MPNQSLTHPAAESAEDPADPALKFKAPRQSGGIPKWHAYPGVGSKDVGVPGNTAQFQQEAKVFSRMLASRRGCMGTFACPVPEVPEFRGGASERLEET